MPTRKILFLAVVLLNNHNDWNILFGYYQTMYSPSITTTHPCPPKILTHPPPPTLKNVPPTSTYPKKCSIHPHTPKMMPHLPHSPLPTQNNAPYNPTHPYPPKITHTHSKSCLTKRHSHKIWSNNPHLLKLLFDHKVK